MSEIQSDMISLEESIAVRSRTHYQPMCDPSLRITVEAIVNSCDGSGPHEDEDAEVVESVAQGGK